MNNKQLFEQAIADAKAVREAALANAKAALEETLSPRIQSMISAKLQEMDDKELDEVDNMRDLDHTNDLGKKQYHNSAAMSESEDLEESDYFNDMALGGKKDLGDTSDEWSDNDTRRGGSFKADRSPLEEEDDADLAEILAALNENDDKDDDDLDEAKKDDKKDDKKKDDKKSDKKDDKKSSPKKNTSKDDEPEEEDEFPSEDEMSAEEEPMDYNMPDMGGEEMGVDDSKSVADLSIGEFREIIKSVVSAELEAEEHEMPSEEEHEPEHMDMGGEEHQPEFHDQQGSEDEVNIDEVDLEELLAELEALDEDANTGYTGVKRDAREKNPTSVSLKDTPYSKRAPVKEAEDEKEEDMKEALDTIQYLRNELNEVNLLNAKLIYVNKIFKAKNLTESQKIKVLESFDKATNTKEAKMIYESLSKTLTVNTKNQIKENLGFASKSAGVAPNKQIVEVNDTISRMQFLAGIKK